MNRILCVLVALLLCAMMVCPALAATEIFVPSISYKDGPDIEDAELDGNDVGNCLVVTSIKQAEEKTTDIYQEDRDLLLEVYKKLTDGTMKLPVDADSYVVRELVDVSFAKTGCVEPQHGHKEWLAKKDNTIKITFDMGVTKDTEVLVLIYLDGKWVAAESVVNNKNGTVTVVMEDICPVAFVVDMDKGQEPPKTGDQAGNDLIIWIITLAASLVALIVLLVRRRRFFQ